MVIKYLIFENSDFTDIYVHKYTFCEKGIIQGERFSLLVCDFYLGGKFKFL